MATARMTVLAKAATATLTALFTSLTRAQVYTRSSHVGMG